MGRLKTSLICTVLNEEKTITLFIDSILNQSILPYELIIIDGGSSDNTLKEINKKITAYKNRIKIKLLTKKGNRSVGRNEAVRQSSSEIILSTDAGNTLDKDWVKNIIKPFSDKSVDVVAGYYKGKGETIFEKCLIPYVLVMPDKVNAKIFLPATRSMAFRKSIWRRIGGFDEKLSHNEDYAFANKLNEKKAKIVFAKEAIVYWIPRKNIFQTFKMFFRFAFGDIQAGILRDKVILLFARYILFFYLLFLSFAYKSLLLLWLISVGVISYIIWSIAKQYKYVNDLRSVFIFPLIQFVADISVISGSFIGFLDRILNLNFSQIFSSNKYLTIIIAFYSLIVISTINWGIPNPNHPFAYGMDEWHSLQSVRSVITHGTTSVEGAANGPIFFYFLTGLYLIPFIILGIIDPLAIKSSIDNLILQNRLFEVLRFSTLIYGILSIILMYKLLRRFITKDALIGTAFFVFTPIFFLLSNYFKYDPAVVFWIILFIYLMLKYSKNHSFKTLVFAAIACALAISVKVSALPLVPVFMISFFLFTQKPTKKILELSFSILIFIFIFLLFGTPDLLFKASAYVFLLSENLIKIPQSISSLNISMPWWEYILIKFYPSTFGYFITAVFYTSVFYLIFFLFKKKKQLLNYKVELFVLMLIFFFFLSLIPLKLTGGGARSFILTPLIAIIISVAYQKIINFYPKFKKYIILILIAGFILQILQIFSWVNLKWQVNPQESSSKWIIDNIEKGTTIGIENIPIYQNLPNIVLREFYFRQYGVKGNYLYYYKIVSNDDPKLPNTIIITNSDVQKYFKSSQTKDILRVIESKGYKKTAKFTLDLRFYEVFNDKAYLIFGNLVQVPSDIVIYKK